MRPIVRDLLRLWRWVFNVPCELPTCHQGRICWRWHLEIDTCPTCQRMITEDEPGYANVLRSLPGTTPAYPIWPSPITYSTGTSGLNIITRYGCSA